MSEKLKLEALTLERELVDLHRQYHLHARRSDLVEMKEKIELLLAVGDALDEDHFSPLGRDLQAEGYAAGRDPQKTTDDNPYQSCQHNTIQWLTGFWYGRRAQPQGRSE